MRETAQQVPPVLSLVCPAAVFSLARRKTNGGEIIERRSCVGGLALDISPPASTSGADGSNDGEEIGRGAASIAAPLRCSPADVA